MRTFQHVFPNSHFFAAVDPGRYGTQNIIMIGGPGEARLDIDFDVLKDTPIAYAESKLLDTDRFELDSHALFTDNYTPVDFMISGVLGRDRSQAPSLGSQANAIIDQLLGYGPRYSGSSGGDDAAGFIAAEIEAHTQNMSKQSWNEFGVEYTNLIGRFQPSIQNRLILGTHYDSKKRGTEGRPVPGANDSGSGAASLLALAAVLGQTDRWPYEFGIDFVFFDGEEGAEGLEEQGPIGSRYFAEHIDELYPLRRPQAAVIADMVCEKSARFAIEARSSEYAPDIVDALWSQGAKINAAMFPRDVQTGLIDDHTALNNIGVKSVLLIDYDYEWYHTLDDTRDKCSIYTLDVVTRTIAEFLSEYGEL